MTFPADQPAEVGRVRIKVHGASHHVHLYRPSRANDPLTYPESNCPAAVDFDKWELVSASQDTAPDWRLPPGVAINFGPRQPLLIQTHFNNYPYEDARTRGSAFAKILLHPVDPATVTAHGGAMFAQNQAVLVPPGRTTVTGRCGLTGEGAAARDMTIMAFTGHYHLRGIEFEVFRVQADGSLGELLYDHQGYEDPPFTQYPADSPLVLHAGEGVEWRCTYQNNSDKTYEFGPNTQENEHCNLFGFYYPTEEPQEAIDCIVHKDRQTERKVVH